MRSSGSSTGVGARRAEPAERGPSRGAAGRAAAWPSTGAASRRRASGCGAGRRRRRGGSASALTRPVRATSLGHVRLLARRCGVVQSTAGRRVRARSGRSTVRPCSSDVHGQRRRAGVAPVAGTPARSAPRTPTTSAPARADQLDGGRGGAAGGQHVVDDQHPVARREGVGVDLERRRRRTPGRRTRRATSPGSLPCLRTGTKPRRARRPPGRARMKPRASMPTTLSTRPARSPRPPARCRRRPREGRGVGQQRRDVLEHHARAPGSRGRPGCSASSSASSSAVPASAALPAPADRFVVAPGGCGGCAAGARRWAGGRRRGRGAAGGRRRRRRVVDVVDAPRSAAAAAAPRRLAAASAAPACRRPRGPRPAWPAPSSPARAP